jgi:hypothetical protein
MAGDGRRRALDGRAGAHGLRRRVLWLLLFFVLVLLLVVVLVVVLVWFGIRLLSRHQAARWRQRGIFRIRILFFFLLLVTHQRCFAHLTGNAGPGDVRRLLWLQFDILVVELGRTRQRRINRALRCPLLRPSLNQIGEYS